MDNLPVGDVWLNFSQQVGGGFIDSDEGTVVELPKSEESQNAD